MGSLNYGVIKQRANHLSYTDAMVLRELAAASNRLHNKALYIKRQDFFKIKAIRKLFFVQSAVRVVHFEPVAQASDFFGIIKNHNIYNNSN